MTAPTGYSAEAPAREDVERWPGVAVLEFGTDGCGFCVGAQPAIRAGLGAASELKHVKVEDGPGRRLGRSFQIKLWPTLIFLRDGKEVARVVRPTRSDEVASALARAMA
jgi:thioredoxin 1